MYLEEGILPSVRKNGKVQTSQVKIDTQQGPWNSVAEGSSKADTV